jgi:hypothetical protein
MGVLAFVKGRLGSRSSVFGIHLVLVSHVPFDQNPHGQRLVELSRATINVLCSGMVEGDVNASRATIMVLCTGMVEGDVNAASSFPTSSGGGTRPDHVSDPAPIIPNVLRIRVQDDLRGSDHYLLGVLLQLLVLHCLPPLPLPVIRRVTWKGSHRRAYVHALAGEDPLVHKCGEFARSGNLAQASSLLM